MLPFLKHISSSNYVFKAVCNILVLNINKSGKKKKWTEKLAASLYCHTQSVFPFALCSSPNLPVGSLSASLRQAFPVSIREGPPSIYTAPSLSVGEPHPTPS
jgi:hypothetical protein